MFSGVFTYCTLTTPHTLLCCSISVVGQSEELDYCSCSLLTQLSGHLLQYQERSCRAAVPHSLSLLLCMYLRSRYGCDEELAHFLIILSGETDQG